MSCTTPFRRIRLALIPALIFNVAGMTLAAPKTFQAWSEMDKLPKAMILGNWKFHVKNLAPQDRPKRVGLLSYMIWDIGDFKYSALAQRYGGTYMQWSGLTSSSGNHFATQFAEQSIPAMKAAFSAHEMELLMPFEFAESEVQQQAYREFDLPLGGLSKLTAKIVDRLRRNPELSAGANGFRPVPAHLFPTDKKARLALEVLRKEMNLDALVVVCVETRSSKAGVGVAKIDAFMWGHNPTPMPKQKIARIAWADMVPYASATFGKGFKGAMVADLKKNKIVREDYSGFGTVVGTLVDRMLAQFDADTR